VLHQFKAIIGLKGGLFFPQHAFNPLHIDILIIAHMAQDFENVPSVGTVAQRGGLRFRKIIKQHAIHPARFL